MMKEYAKEYNVPIMMEDGINFITNFIIKHKVKNVLEIGTAIGYSAILMALSSPNVKITSIERDRERYLEAVKNVKKFNGTIFDEVRPMRKLSKKEIVRLNEIDKNTNNLDYII